MQPKTSADLLPLIISTSPNILTIKAPDNKIDMAAYLARHSGYIVCNVQYRLLSDNGNTTTMNDIVEDVFGTVIWVKELHQSL